jgi:hypothetical protein
LIFLQRANMRQWFSRSPRGAAMAGMYGTFALCLWYATELIRNGKMSGGTALTARLSTPRV